MGELRPIRRHAGRPSSWALIAAADASIFAHFSHSDIGMEMDPKIGYPKPRLGRRKRAPLIPKRSVRDLRYFLDFLYNRYRKYGGGSVAEISPRKGMRGMSTGIPIFPRMSEKSQKICRRPSRPHLSDHYPRLSTDRSRLGRRLVLHDLRNIL